MSQYNGTFEEIDRQLDWLAQTNDKTTVPVIKKLLHGLQMELAAVGEAQTFGDKVGAFVPPTETIGDVSAEEAPKSRKKKVEADGAA